ncbi:hypothetical protein PGIGA_G00033750 [Pangasianodon gigas]|uniref:Uncharacterized protein n=1 Tax=Pangasianodon gigas TaxID=30993 RepID=A0ACC5WY66_PANGG|nr:hypothetical protein [Pangasianodon gigas]
MAVVRYFFQLRHRLSWLYLQPLLDTMQLFDRTQRCLSLQTFLLSAKSSKRRWINVSKGRVQRPVRS